MTITHDALDLTVQAPGPASLLVTCGGNHWSVFKLVHARPLPPLRSDIRWWPLNHLQFLVDVYLVSPASNPPESKT